jgi:hypothetical protein
MSMMALVVVVVVMVTDDDDSYGPSGTVLRLVLQWVQPMLSACACTPIRNRGSIAEGTLGRPVQCSTKFKFPTHPDRLLGADAKLGVELAPE